MAQINLNEHIKKRQGAHPHPSEAYYNRTAGSANKTVATLIKIITTLRERQDVDGADPLLEILSGRNKDTLNTK